MSKITNINDAPMVSPKEAKILALKDGKMARCDFSELIAIIEKVQHMNVDELKANFEIAKANFMAIDAQIKNLEARYDAVNKLAEERIIALEKTIKASTTAEVASEEVGELPKSKAGKRVKKQADSAE